MFCDVFFFSENIPEYRLFSQEFQGKRSLNDRVLPKYTMFPLPKLRSKLKLTEIESNGWTVEKYNGS